MKKHSIFDPSQFNDAVAMNTAWFPKGKSDEFSIKDYKLVKVNPYRMELQVTLLFRFVYPVIFLLFLMFFIFLAYIVSEVEIIDFAKISKDKAWPIVIAGGIGGTLGNLVVVYALIRGFFHYMDAIKPIVFDKQLGSTWKGKTINEGKYYAKLKNIHALQLLCKFIKYDLENHSDKYCYELNIILKNGVRINIYKDYDKDTIVDHANSLALFLDKPVWNAITYNQT